MTPPRTVYCIIQNHTCLLYRTSGRAEWTDAVTRTAIFFLMHSSFFWLTGTATTSNVQHCLQLCSWPQGWHFIFIHLVPFHQPDASQVSLVLPTATGYSTTLHLSLNLDDILSVSLKLHKCWIVTSHLLYVALMRYQTYLQKEILTSIWVYDCRISKFCTKFYTDTTSLRTYKNPNYISSHSVLSKI